MMNSAARAPRGPSWIRWIASAGAKLPTANTIVANRISHGTRLAKIAVGVHNSRSAPISPPTRLKTNKPRTLNSATARIVRRYAHAPANVPENGATTLDAFASMGLRPANRSAGNVPRVPPPASEFRAPPRNAAAMRTIVVTSCGMCGLCEAVNPAVPSRELGSDGAAGLTIFTNFLKCRGRERRLFRPARHGKAGLACIGADREDEMPSFSHGQEGY